MRILRASEASGAPKHELQSYRFLNEDFGSVFDFFIEEM
jgi:hypothetical protein